MTTSNFRWKTPAATGLGIPTPVVEIRQLPWSGVSSFAGDSLSGLNSVFVRTPDFEQSVFAASAEPVLELAWFRKRWGTGEGRLSGAPNKGWAFPDDAVLKYGGDQGAGSQMGDSGSISLTRRSKWDVSGVADLEFITGQRIELEHYFKLQDVRLLPDAETDRFDGIQIQLPVPTFVPPAGRSTAFSTSQYDVSRTTPRYHGYWNGYFAFAFSVKDLNGSHPGDRVRGPMSKVVQVRGAAADGGFPIWPKRDGFAAGESASHLKAFLV